MNPEQLLDQFSTHLKNAIARALATSVTLGSMQAEPIHMLHALAQEQGSIGAEIMKKYGLDADAISEFMLPAQQINAEQTLPQLNTEAKRILEKAVLVAYEHEHSYVGTEHLLAGVLLFEHAQTEAVLAARNVNRSELIKQLNTVFESTSRFPQVDDIQSLMQELAALQNQSESSEESTPQRIKRKKGSKKGKTKQPSMFELFTTDLTEKEIQEGIDPVVGREQEIERLIHILCRRNKNNPVLLGEAGVGKTAIVEGLAKRIAEGSVPDILKRKKIVSLDMTLLVAGTIYRGEFESRLKQIIDELTRKKDYIVFIDELHTIIGAGSNQGTMDAANILKPALARGQIRCIGATTIDEYRKHIAADPALARRFQSIDVEEPTPEEAITILSGVKPQYEAFHGTVIADEAITAAVELSARYIHDAFLPDKALDLIDEACARVRSKRKESAADKKIYTIKDKLKSLRQQKEQAIRSEQFDEAKALKKTIEQQEQALKKAKQAAKKKKKYTDPVDLSDIAHVLAQRINVPTNILLQDKWETLESLGAHMKAQIFGHDTTIDGIVETIKRAELRPTSGKTPLASLLFAGPSGVGKTATATALATHLYHDPKALIRLDMSEFSEGHGVSKLLGSPAGYVGYKERNRFFEAIEKRPYCVILFDEFDKAHPDVRKLLLQILDEGSLTDSRGKTISFRHAIIVLTTNIGEKFFRSSGIGFANQSPSNDRVSPLNNIAITAALTDELGQALMTRIKHTALFGPLSEESIKHIIRYRLSHLLKDLKTSRDITIKAPERTITALTKSLYKPNISARHIDAAIESILYEQVIHALATSDEQQFTLTKKQDTFVLS